MAAPVDAMRSHHHPQIGQMKVDTECAAMQGKSPALALIDTPTIEALASMVSCEPKSNHTS